MPHVRARWLHVLKITAVQLLVGTASLPALPLAFLPLAAGQPPCGQPDPPTCGKQGSVGGDAEQCRNPIAGEVIRKACPALCGLCLTEQPPRMHPAACARLLVNVSCPHKCLVRSADGDAGDAGTTTAAAPAATTAPPPGARTCNGTAEPAACASLASLCNATGAKFTFTGGAAPLHVGMGCPLTCGTCSPEHVRDADAGSSVAATVDTTVSTTASTAPATAAAQADADIVFLLDASSSINVADLGGVPGANGGFFTIKRFVKDVVRLLGDHVGNSSRVGAGAPRVRVAIVTFMGTGKSSRVVACAESEQLGVAGTTARVNGIRYTSRSLLSETDIAGALVTARHLCRTAAGTRGAAMQHVVVLTDGKDGSDQHDQSLYVNEAALMPYQVKARDKPVVLELTHPHWNASAPTTRWAVAIATAHAPTIARLASSPAHILDAANASAPGALVAAVLRRAASTGHAAAATTATAAATTTTTTTTEAGTPRVGSGTPPAPGSSTAEAGLGQTPGENELHAHDNRTTAAPAAKDGGGGGGGEGGETCCIAACFLAPGTAGTAATTTAALVAPSSRAPATSAAASTPPVTANPVGTTAPTAAPGAKVAGDVNVGSGSTPPPTLVAGPAEATAHTAARVQDTTAAATPTVATAADGGQGAGQDDTVLLVVVAAAVLLLLCCVCAAAPCMCRGRRARRKLSHATEEQAARRRGVTRQDNPMYSAAGKDVQRHSNPMYNRKASTLSTASSLSHSDHDYELPSDREYTAVTDNIFASALAANSMIGSPIVTLRVPPPSSAGGAGAGAGGGNMESKLLNLQFVRGSVYDDGTPAAGVGHYETAVDVLHGSPAAAAAAVNALPLAASAVARDTYAVGHYETAVDALPLAAAAVARDTYAVGHDYAAQQLQAASPDYATPAPLQGAEASASVGAGAGGAAGAQPPGAVGDDVPAPETDSAGPTYQTLPAIVTMAATQHPGLYA